VQDNGVGIKPEDQVKLFTAFHQIEAGALQKGGGSGLGLSICKEIVRRHGGAVGVQSAPGQGSTFYAEVSCGVGALLEALFCWFDAAFVAATTTIPPVTSFPTQVSLQTSTLFPTLPSLPSRFASVAPPCADPLPRGAARRQLCF